MPITLFEKFPDNADQAYGERRGYVEATFDDARKVRRSCRAQGLANWQTKAASLEAEIYLKQQEEDAFEAANEFYPIDDQPFKQAEPKRVARAICRQAMNENTLGAYHHFVAWDGWRTRRSLTIVQAKNRMQELTDNPLTDEEWNEIKDRRAWIMNAGRDQICADFQTVVDGDTWE